MNPSMACPAPQAPGGATTSFARSLRSREEHHRPPLDLAPQGRDPQRRPHHRSLNTRLLKIKSVTKNLTKESSPGLHPRRSDMYGTPCSMAKRILPSRNALLAAKNFRS